MLFGVVLPALITSFGAMSAPKRISLLVLNHPVETICEIVLIASIPLINYLLWNSLCKNNRRFSCSTVWRWRRDEFRARGSILLIRAGGRFAAVAIRYRNAFHARFFVAHDHGRSDLRSQRLYNEPISSNTRFFSVKEANRNIHRVRSAGVGSGFRAGRDTLMGYSTSGEIGVLKRCQTGEGGSCSTESTQSQESS